MESTSDNTKWQVSGSIPEGLTLEELVLAWARDSETGEPVYIFSLGKDRRGAKCGCECYSCGLPLTAVNAAKTEFLRRPHFRHPEGTQRQSCAILSARAIALESLKGIGLLQLPKRRKSARLAGLSGQYHEAWVELPPETICVRHFEIRDKVSGILTLDDGRQLKVQLVGSAETQNIDDFLTVVPTILLAVDDPQIAAMSPEDIRKRLHLIVDSGIWCSHWADNLLTKQAEDAAKAMAEAALDWLDDIPEGVEPASHRETLLHLKAKEILERERRLMLPALDVTVTATMPNGMVQKRTSVLHQAMVTLSGVSLETPMGNIRPDVFALTEACDCWPANQVLVEITVTNAISDERLARIREVGLPALEIDISRMGGRVTEVEFTRLVVDEAAGKRWLFHPWIAEEQAKLRILLEEDAHAMHREKEELDARIQRRETLKQIPATEWAQKYLDSVQCEATCRAMVGQPHYDPTDMEFIIQQIAECEEALAIHGFLSPFHQKLSELISKIIVLKDSKAPGSWIRVRDAINDILGDGLRRSDWQSIYLIAIRAYAPDLSEYQQKRVDSWRNDVLTSLRTGEKTYRRNRGYDSLLSLLFPEMADLLLKPLPGERDEPVRQPNYFVPRGASDLWLSGRELEEWKRRNPESAKVWFPENDEPQKQN